MKQRTVSVVLLLLLALGVVALAGCDSTGDVTTETTAGAAGDTTSSTATTPTDPTGSTDSTGATETTESAPPVLAIGDVAKVEQGSLSVSKITVTDDLASDKAKELLFTGEDGEGESVSKTPAEGNEYVMITFMYKKAASYGFRGGVYPEDLILANADGVEYPLVETNGFGGLYNSKAGEVGPDVEAFTTAVFEVPEGEKGLVLTYHHHYPDVFSVTIR